MVSKTVILLPIVAVAGDLFPSIPSTFHFDISCVREQDVNENLATALVFLFSLRSFRSSLVHLHQKTVITFIKM